jgi:DNA-binding winged helix-turn-helix (wHTH) protein
MGKADAARVSAPNPEWVYMSQQWKIELDQRELRAHGIPVPIGNRAFEIISVLVQSADKLVSKDGLMVGFGVRFVEENTTASLIFALQH